MKKDRISTEKEIRRKMEKSVADKLFEGRTEKERRNSIGCIEKMWKRKKEVMKKSREGEEEVFKRSKK